MAAHHRRHDLVAHSRHRQCASPRRRSMIPIGSRSSPAIRRSTVARRTEARCRCRVLQRPRPQLLPRQDADVRHRRRVRISEPDEGWGLPVVGKFPGDPELSWHIIEHWSPTNSTSTTCQEMRSTMLHRADAAVLWAPDQEPDQDHPVCDQHRAASAADADRAAKSRSSDRSRDRNPIAPI